MTNIFFKVNTTIDWDGSILNYICMNPRNRFVPDESIESIIEFENIPEAYEVKLCMKISYYYMPYNYI